MSLLSQVQRDDADRIWKSQMREIVHVVTTRETLAAAAKQVIPPHDMQQVVHLYEFFLAHLKILQRNESSNNPLAIHLKFRDNPQQSSLEQYARLALVSSTADANNNNSEAEATALSQTPQRPKKVVRLFEGRRVISLHYKEFTDELDHFMLKGEPMTEPWRRTRSFGAYLYHEPRRAFVCIGTAMRLAMITLWRSAAAKAANSSSSASFGGPQLLPTQQPSSSSVGTPSAVKQFLDASQILIRVLHVDPRLPMMDIKTGSVGKLVAVKGHVVKARPKRLRVATAEFACNKCGACIIHAFDQGKYSVPTKCTTAECKSRAFIMNRTMAQYINVQELRLQEAQEESTAHSGRTPRQMPVEVTDDLVDSCRPGDIVLVACIVDTVNTAVAAGRMGKRAKETSTYTLVLLGHSITTLSETSAQNRRGSQQQQQQYSQQQLQSITQLSHADHRYFGMTERMAFPFDLLVRSLCPAIVGHHEVKAGILLCLLGGTPPATAYNRAAASGEIRSNSHILVVGDPGMGKSQMLLAASQIAARSVYVGGNTASTTGLTVTLTKEERGESGIEAGALVLSDQGVCCIDEFDKMAKLSQDGLLEAMEQQQVSIAKAGVVASLPARCSVIAAANPKHGSYNMNKTVAENLTMSKPILSRFDLVFILRDRANQDLDRLVSSNIMNLYREQGKDSSNGIPKPATSSPMTYSQQNQEPSHPTSGGEDRIPIWNRLAWVAEIQKTPLPAELVRDYIAYAREYCKPKLTAEAATVLKEYYMQLRYPETGNRKDTVPITTRQLEAMIRLAQARAKACLREYVLKGDALDVVELMKKSVDQVHSDEGGSLDATRGGAGGMSNRKMRKMFEKRVQEVIGIGAECLEDDLRCIADQVKCGLAAFKPMIDDMRDKGVLLRTADGKYKVLA